MVKTKRAKTLKRDEVKSYKFWLNNILASFLYFIFSIFTANKGIYGKFYPFGISFIGSVPYPGRLFTAIGSIISYFLNTDINFSIKYMAAVILIYTVRWALKEIRIEHYKLYSPILCSTILFLISIPVYVNGGFLPLTFFNNFLESVLAGIYSYFLKESIFNLLNYFNNSKKIEINNALIKNKKDLIIFCVTFFTFLISFLSMKVGPISLVKVLSIYTILLLTKNGGIFGSIVSATIFSFIFNFRINCVTTNILDTNSLIFLPFCALILGLFSKQNKIKISLLYIFLNLILNTNLFSSFGTENILTSFYESILACLFFTLTPGYVGKRLINLKNLENESNLSFVNLQKYISTRLSFLADSFFNIGSSVNIVSNGSEKSEKIERLKETIEAINKEICSECRLNAFCWNVRKEETTIFLQDYLQNKNSYAKSKLIKRCDNLQKIKNYADILKNENNEKSIVKKRINEMKDFMVEQFKDVGNVLKYLSLNLEKNYNFKYEISNRVAQILSENGILALDIFCREISDNKWIFEICINLKDKEKFKKLDIKDILEKEFKRKFKNAVLKEKFREKLTYVIKEEPKYQIELGVTQHICQNGNFCGDNYKYFETEDGKLIIILSDGMGTGVRAAVEGAMACEIMSTLIKCNIEFEIALKITNTTLLMNPNEESLATLDIISINLYTGEAEFIKAGAPATFIKSNGKTKKVFETSLPVGILKNINYYNEKATLKSKDKIIMMSDGVIYPENELINDKTIKWEDNSSKEISNYIVKKSLEHRKSENDDDITVLAIKVT